VNAVNQLLPGESRNPRSVCTPSRVKLKRFATVDEVAAMAISLAGEVSSTGQHCE
jgi:hypothetical protein